MRPYRELDNDETASLKHRRLFGGVSRLLCISCCSDQNNVKYSGPNIMIYNLGTELYIESGLGVFADSEAYMDFFQTG
jgi:hypothetical protein